MATPAISDADFTRLASAAVARIERENGFSGVILVAHGGHVLLRQSAGFSDRERQTRNTPETQFPLESVTKQFTATAIMMLVDERKISLDDSILKYYPEGPATWRNIKSRHLLTHSSDIEDRPGLPQSRDDFLRAVQIPKRLDAIGTALLAEPHGWEQRANCIDAIGDAHPVAL